MDDYRYEELIQCVMETCFEEEITQRIDDWYDAMLLHEDIDANDLDRLMLNELELICLEYGVNK